MSKRNRPSAAVVTTVLHALLRSWTGGIGECGVECACGLIFDGFDTVTAARNARWDHYLDSIAHPAWCVRDWCGYGGSELHQGAEHAIPATHGALVAQLGQVHADVATADPVVTLIAGEDSPTDFIELSLAQAEQLRDQLDALLGQAGRLTNEGAVKEAFRLGAEIYRDRYVRGEAATVRAYAAGYTDGTAGREPNLNSALAGMEPADVAAATRAVRTGKTVAALKDADRTPVNPRARTKSTDCKPTARLQVSARVPAARVGAA